ncbi:MAG: hypothetical protein ACYS8W_10365 [Planctomycetota bacterium]|jgi:hypothetical protein
MKKDTSAHSCKQIFRGTGIPACRPQAKPAENYSINSASPSLRSVEVDRHECLSHVIKSIRTSKLIGFLIIAALATTALLGTGCTYMKQRGLDFADIFTGKLIYGLGTHADVNVLGLVYVAAGGTKGKSLGFEGRYYVEEDWLVLGVPAFQGAVPCFFASIGGLIIGCPATIISFGMPGYKRTEYTLGDEKAPGINWLKNVTGSTCHLRRVYLSALGANVEFPDPDLYSQNPPPDGRFYHYNDISLSFSLFGGFEVGISPLEFVDFLAGVFTLDPLNDDKPLEETTPEKDKPEPANNDLETRYALPGTSSPIYFLPINERRSVPEQPSSERTAP